VECFVVEWEGRGIGGGEGVGGVDDGGDGWERRRTGWRRKRWRERTSDRMRKGRGDYEGEVREKGGGDGKKEGERRRQG
jgi:hypothetical protein